jgi:hypothetical protein
MVLETVLDNFKNAFCTLEKADDLRYSLTNEQQHIIKTFFYAVRYKEFSNYFFPSFGTASFESFDLKFKVALHDKRHISSGFVSIHFYKKRQEDDTYKLVAIPSMGSFLKAHKLLSMSEKALQYAQNTEKLFTCLNNLNTQNFTDKDIAYFVNILGHDNVALTLLLPTFSKSIIAQIFNLIHYLT